MDNKTVILILGLAWGLLVSCSDNPHENEQGGITIIDNTIATDTGRVQVSVAQGKDTTVFYSTVRSAARSIPVATLQSVIAATPTPKGGAWDFAKADSIHYLDALDKSTSMIVTNGSWSSLLNGTLFFDSTTCVNIPHRDSYLSDNMSIEAHIFPTQYPSLVSKVKSIVQKGHLDLYPSTSGFALVLAPSGAIYGMASTEESIYSRTLQSKQTIPLNQWSMVRMDLSPTSMSLWINGIKVADTSFADVGTIYNTRDLRIGCDSNYNQAGKLAGSFDGLMDHVSLLYSGNSTAPHHGSTLTDSRDGRIYKTNKVGGRIWMAENLAWTPPAGNFWWPNNDSATNSKYGRLYDWNTIMSGSPSYDSKTGNVKGICPTGWHLPSNNEWAPFFTQAPVDLGKQLKSSLWDGNNLSFFDALPSGSRNSGGIFVPPGTSTYFWSSSENGASNALVIGLQSGNPSTVVDSTSSTSLKSNGYPVRCIKDI